MSISRRSFLLGTAAFAATTVGGPALAQFGTAPFPARFSSVTVDVSRLHALGLGGFAELVRGSLQAEAQRAFADRLGGGPRLVIRITAISMTSYAGGEGGRRNGGGSGNDYLEGEALAVGPRGEIIARHPQLSALPAASGGAWYDPASERRRVLLLAQHYAGWLRRSLAG
jgi:hypothetical protein